VALVVLQFFHIVHAREETLATARKETTNLTISLVQHAELTFRTADASLAAITSQIERSPASTGISPGLRDFLVRQVQQSSLFRSFAVVGSDGKVTVNTAGENVAGRFSDRDYFIYHQDHADKDIRIGSPIEGRTTPGWLIPVTRRINRPDGSFGGVAIAAINPAYFQDFYDGLEIGKSGAIMLVSGDKLLVRRPFRESNPGRDMADSNVVRLMRSKPSGSAEYSATTDGVERLTSYRVGQTYPIVIAVGIQMDELLAPWRSDTVRRVVETVVIVAILALLGIIVGRMTLRLAQDARKLRRSNERFDVMMDTMSQGVCLFDHEKRIVMANRNYAEIYRLAIEDVRPGTRLVDVLRSRQEKGIGLLTPDEYFADAAVSDAAEDHNLSDGRVISITRHALEDGGWLAMHEDITVRANAERHSAYLAGHDQLTGLPNRYQFSAFLDDIASKRRRLSDHVAVFMLDLDGFKNVNDTLGHGAGDQLLVTVARRLQDCVRETDLVARLGGDEFAIVQMLDGDEHLAVEALASRIVAAVAAPIAIDSYPIGIGVSIGISLLPGHGTDPQELLRKADLALYATKAAGKNGFRIFHPDMAANHVERRARKKDLREALQK
jgi:diguanylate cyclase (GGDEF)-like protein